MAEDEEFGVVEAHVGAAPTGWHARRAADAFDAAGVGEGVIGGEVGFADFAGVVASG